MWSWRKLVRRVEALWARRRIVEELDEELRFHLEMEATKMREQGLAPAEADRRARARFGGVERFREETQDARGGRALEDLGRDLRVGFRSLRRRPGFAAVVVLTLGVGVGGSAALFGAVGAVLLEPLPYPEAHRLLVVWQQDRKAGARQEVSPANFLDWRARSRSFAPLTAMEPFGLDWLRPEGPIYLPTWLVYEGFFDLFGTRPLLGRTLRADEHTPGRGDVVVLGYRLWKTHFGGAAGVVGRVITLDGRPHRVVGVMPEGFAQPSDEVVWAPKVLSGWEGQSRSSNFYTVFGRLREGVDRRAAAGELEAIAAQLGREHPRTNASVGVTLVPLPDQIVGGVRRALLLLLGAVGLVLAVVTASVASMQLARVAGRAREFAVRRALGAGWGRLARQLLAENLLLAAGGTALGFVLAYLALEGARALAPPDFPRLTELKADGRVLLFASILSLGAAVLTAIVPMLVAGRARLHGSPVQGGRGATRGRVMVRAQGGLVVAQLCLSLVLLIGAGLLVRSFLAVVNQPRGFRTDGVVALTVQSWGYYPDPTERSGFVGEVIRRLEALPGVQAAGMTSSVPLMETIGAEQAPFTIEGQQQSSAEAPALVHFSVAAGGLFEALGIPLQRGRRFDSRDGPQGAPVVLVNETFARRHFPGQNPVGRRIVFGGSLASRQSASPPRQIVGVVGDVRRFGLHETARPAVYLPHGQQPTGANAFVVWGAGRPADLLRLVKKAIWAQNPSIPVYRETTFPELLGASLRERRFLLVLLNGFALLALGLAAAGIFGLMSYVTAERTREFGVRMALGARRGQVLAVVLRRAIALAAFGIGLGLLGALALTHLLAGLLYTVTPFDPATFAAAAALLLVTTVLACWHPAWRAGAIDPVGALRAE